MDQLASLPIVTQFDDPAAVAAALRDASVEYLSHARGHFAASLTSACFGPARLQITSDGPHISRGSIAPDRTALLFPLQPSAMRPIVNGFALSHQDAMVLGGEAGVEGQVAAPVMWAAISFETDALRQVIEGEAIPGAGDFVPHRLAGALAATLSGRVREIGAVAVSDPYRLIGESTQHSIADELLGLSRRVMRTEPIDVANLRALRRRVRLVRLADDYLASRIGLPVYSEQLRAALGVPMRTLHDACIAVRGMSVHRYLRIWRLNLAHQALRDGGQDGPIQVKAAALRFGFWHFGRFAQEYRALFGELPSDTARRA